jgi:hypothetical protein
MLKMRCRLEGWTRLENPMGKLKVKIFRYVCYERDFMRA